MPRWTTSNANTGARPAFAQMTHSAFGSPSQVTTVVTTQDWRLSNEGGTPMLQRRVAGPIGGTETERWESADNPAPLVSLLKSYTEHAPKSATGPKQISPETLNALRKAGYW